MRRLVAALLVCLPAIAAEPGRTHLPDVSPLQLLNERLPKWVRFSGELRAREEGFLGSRFTRGADDMYILQRIRLNVQLQPLKWLQVYAQGQDARVSFTDRVPSAPPLQDSADLRQLYVQAGTKLFDVRVGRQEMGFGEQRLVGPANWGNAARSFDAVRLAIHHAGYHFDIFSASVVVARDHEFNRHRPGDNLHGFYGDITAWIPKATVQPYLFWRLAPSVASERGGRGPQDLKTTGIRIDGALPAGFLYTTEMAVQNGTRGGDSAGAWAGFWRIGRDFRSLPLKPRLLLEMNHATGDRNPGDGHYGTFELLYPTPHDKYGLADQVGWRNANHIGFIAEVKPVKTLALQFKAHERWLASATDGLYNAQGNLLVRDPTGQSGRYIGKEFDVQVIWNASKRANIAGGIGYMLPGSFLQKTTPGHSFIFPYIQLTYGL